MNRHVISSINWRNSTKILMFLASILRVGRKLVKISFEFSLPDSSSLSSLNRYLSEFLRHFDRQYTSKKLDLIMQVNVILRLASSISCYTYNDWKKTRRKCVIYCDLQVYKWLFTKLNYQNIYHLTIKLSSIFTVNTLILVS